MDIAALSTSMASSELLSSVGYAMLGNSLDTAQSVGSGITEMIDAAPAAALEHSVTPYLGGNFDMSV